MRGLPREKVLATVVHLLETTLIRVGNDDYAKENNSYGLTTLKNRHVAVEGNEVHFRFNRGFAEPKLLAHLPEREADALIISGSETDVCVLATALSAVDLGYRVIVVRDAVCSSSDEGDDMLLRLYHTRFSAQIETADAATILSRWH